jgi:hypothetical protein
MWRIVPQQVRKSLVLVKVVKRFPKFDANNQYTGSGLMTDPAHWSVSCMIGNQRKVEMVMRLSYNPTSGRWSLQHPPKLEYPPLRCSDSVKVNVDGTFTKVKGTIAKTKAGVIIPNKTAGKVEMPGNRESYDTRIEFMDRISRFTGPDFAAQAIALLTLAARELMNETPDDT